MKNIPFTSLRQDWQTPEETYRLLDAEFHFNFDPCPRDFASDGLAKEWGARTFVNPPYNQISKWVYKAAIESRRGKLVVLLIPARTDTRWWHEWVMSATEIRFIKGRLKFGGATNSAPFPSCVVVFDGTTTP